MGFAILIYSVFLIPYIGITYYIRYSLPLTLIQILFIFWGIDLLYDEMKRLKNYIYGLFAVGRIK